MKAWLSELKRRGVFRAAAIYVAGAWVVVEAADTLTPHLGLPAWTVRAVVGLAIAGLPFALLVAWFYDLTRSGFARAPPADRSPDEAVPSPDAGGRYWAVAVIVAVLLATGAWLALRPNLLGPDLSLDDGVVAVLPFRVSAEPSLEYLGEGIIDLFSASIENAAEVRVVAPAPGPDPGVAGRAAGEEPGVAEAALARARRVGAAEVLTGAVVGRPASLTIRAELRDVSSGRLRATGAETGPVDSVARLTDRLTRRLLALRAGEGEERASLLVDVSIPALRAYLRARAAARRHDDRAAIEHYATALSRDTAFVLAALGLTWHREWVPPVPPELLARAERVAWRGRDRLAASDRRLLTALLGPRYPDPSSGAELIDAARVALDASPERSELWHLYGDRLFHEGAVTGIPNADAEASRAFDRTAAIDTALVAGWVHRVALDWRAGDTLGVGALARRVIAVDSSSQDADRARWWLAWATGDSATLERLRESARSGERPMPVGLALEIQSWIFREVDLAEAAWAAAIEEAATTAPDRGAVLLAWERMVARNRGRHRRAEAALAELARRSRPEWEVEEPIGERFRPLQWIPLMDAFFWEVNPARVADAERAVRPVALGTAEAAPFDRIASRCWGELWRLRNGDTRDTEAILRRLRRDRYSLPADRAYADFCALVIEARSAAIRGRPESLALVNELDSVASTAPPYVDEFLLYAGSYTAARIYEARGDLRRAYDAALRRRPWYGGLFPGFLSLYLKESGRLAALNGDREEAIRAYTAYLRLREDADPRLQTEIERVRSELERLKSGAEAR